MGQIHSFLNLGALPEAGEILDSHLDENVAQHVKVLRIKAGENLRFLDGQGLITEVTCKQIKPRPTFAIVERKRAPALIPPLELCVSPPKGDAFRDVVAQATEIGATSIRFLRSDFGQYPAGQPAPSDKAQRVSDSAAEQCVRAWRCEVLPGWHEALQTLALPGIHVVADEESANAAQESIGFLSSAPSLANLSPAAPLRLYVGPEGGWSERERTFFRDRAHSLSLGRLVLRVPTAAVAGLHWLRAYGLSKTL